MWATLLVGVTHELYHRSVTPPTPPAIVDVKPRELSFTSQDINSTSAPRTVRLTNKGSSPLKAVVSLGGDNPVDFHLENGCSGAVPPGQACALSIRFRPEAEGRRRAVLSIVDNAHGSPHAVALAGTGNPPPQSPPPDITIEPTLMTFADRPVGSTSAEQVGKITSSGTAPLVVTGVTIEGDEFIETTDCASGPVAPRVSCAVRVRFRPRVAGVRSATLTIADNAPGNPHVIFLSGSGVAPEPFATLSSASLDFGDQSVGSSSPEQTVTLGNRGSARLLVPGVAVEGSQGSNFKVADSCSHAILAPGGGCAITVKFAPTGSGARSARLMITDSAKGSPHSVSLTGQGIALPVPPPHVAFEASPQKLTFSNSRGIKQGMGMQKVTVTSTGTASLRISSVTLVGSQASDFKVTGDHCTGSLMAPGATCTFSVEFTPRALGNRSAQLFIRGDAVTSPYEVQIAGTEFYQGPAAGLVTWSGELERNDLVTIERDRTASGSIQGALPGVPVRIDLNTGHFAVAEAPGPDNGWNRLVVRSRNGGKMILTVRWEVIRQ